MVILPDKTNIIYIYRKLIASLAKIKGFDGYMIARAEFKTEKIKNTENQGNSVDSNDNNIEISNKFIKQRKTSSVISASTIYNNTKYILIMYIIKPGNIFSANPVNSCKPHENSYLGYSYLFTLEYTKDDIKKYIEYTGDQNPLHQPDKPVVPGFLMFEGIIAKKLYKDMADNSMAGYIICFRSPVFADEAVEIYSQDNNSGKIIALQAGNLTAKKWELYPV